MIFKFYHEICTSVDWNPIMTYETKKEPIPPVPTKKIYIKNLLLEGI